MPYKDQTRCYRTIDGIKWFNLCDILDGRDEEDVKRAKSAGVRVRLRKHPEGYQQAFFHPEDEEKLDAALNCAA